MAAPELGFDGGLACAFPVSDVSESIKWYKETLGFELIFHVEDVGWAEVKTSVENVTIGFSAAEEFEPDGGNTLTFGVKDIDKARSKAKGDARRKLQPIQNALAELRLHDALSRGDKEAAKKLVLEILLCLRQ